MDMAVQYKDYYESLGVARTASDAEIKKGVSQAGCANIIPTSRRTRKRAEEKFKENQ